MPERPSNDQRDNATFAALTMVMFVVMGLVALVAFVIPAVLWFVLVPIGLGVLMVLHYLTWGRWLAAALRDRATAETDADGKNKETKEPL